ncbi:MAG: tetratricopeptide repeat protein [Puniceicoccales bacterium]|nr:tetratricopeptide repeat protein [Puniceicoccales bacterium]
MAHKLRLGVVFLLIGVNLPCFSNSWNRSRRNRNAITQVKGVPLVDLLSQARDAEARNNSGVALKLYEKICKDYKTSDGAPEAYFFRGTWYEKDHRFSTATKMFTKIMKYYPESPYFASSVVHCFQIAEKLRAGIRPHYFGTIPGFRDFDSAIKNYESVVRHAPRSCYALESLEGIADLQLREKHYDLAIDALSRIIDWYPDSVEVPYAYLKIAEIYKSLVKGEEYNQGGAVVACRYYQEFITLFPQHPEVSFVEKMIRDQKESIVKSKISMGDFYFNARYNDKAAKTFYFLAIYFAPYTVAADLARSRIAEIDGGKKPKSTPIDLLFPSYKPQSNDEFVAAATVQDRIMDQKDGRTDPVSKKSVTPFIKSEDVLGSDEV